MSHYTTIRTRISDMGSLICAVESMGYQYKTGKNLPMYDFCGNKTAYTADLVIPRKYLASVSNDIGFSRQEDGTYRLIISDYDQTAAKIKDFPQQIRQRYAYFKVKKELQLEDNKQIIEEKKHVDGSIEIIVEA
jgi:hypothetical protein